MLIGKPHRMRARWALQHRAAAVRPRAWEHGGRTVARTPVPDFPGRLLLCSFMMGVAHPVPDEGGPSPRRPATANNRSDYARCSAGGSR